MTFTDKVLTIITTATIAAFFGAVLLGTALLIMWWGHN